MSRTQEIDEEAMLLSTHQTLALYTPMSQGDMMSGRSARRRRRKSKVAEGEGKKRRLSEEQVRLLEMSFGSERKLESGRKARLASELGLDPNQVAVWFQNRRARWKGKQLESEYTRLKSMHDAAILDKCLLQAEVLKLKEQLSEAEKEIRKLSAVSGSSDAMSCGERSSTPTSPSSMDARQPLLGLGGGEDLMSMHDYTNYLNMMEWANLYGI